MACSFFNQYIKLFTFRALFLWIHVITVVCWIGGIIFSTFIAGPILSGKSALDGGVQFHARMVHRFQRLSRELLFIILLTGIFNLVNRGILNQFNFSTAYLTVLGTKFTILLAIAGLQAFYSLKLMPDLTLAMLEDPDNSRYIDRSRRRLFWTACLMVALGCSAIFMGLNLGFM